MDKTIPARKSTVPRKPWRDNFMTTASHPFQQRRAQQHQGKTLPPTRMARGTSIARHHGKPAAMRQLIKNLELAQWVRGNEAGAPPLYSAVVRNQYRIAKTRLGAKNLQSPGGFAAVSSCQPGRGASPSACGYLRDRPRLAKTRP
jgi:hypothetical protein